MFDHVVFGVTDYAASRAFYLKALQPLGVTIVQEGSLGLELSTDGKSSLCPEISVASQAAAGADLVLQMRAVLSCDAPGLFVERQATTWRSP